MSENESTALKHWSVYYKTVHSNSSAEQKAFRLNLMAEMNWLSKDPKVLNLLKDGIETFRTNTAQRIYRDHHEILDFNHCPKCGKLARTPLAKQCRFCLDDWH